MNISRYRLILYLHIVLILFDLFINTFIDILRAENVIQLILFVFQDTCLLFDVIIIFLLFFSTYVFQAGLIWMLISRFRIAIAISLIYLTLSIAHHVWKLTLGWDDPHKYIWSKGYLILYVIQRTASVLFYYFYNQTILRIADPRFYQRSEWIDSELARRT